LKANVNGKYSKNDIYLCAPLDCAPPKGFSLITHEEYLSRPNDMTVSDTQKKSTEVVSIIVEKTEEEKQAQELKKAARKQKAAEKEKALQELKQKREEKLLAEKLEKKLAKEAAAIKAKEEADRLAREEKLKAEEPKPEPISIIQNDEKPVDQQIEIQTPEEPVERIQPSPTIPKESFNAPETCFTQEEPAEENNYTLSGFSTVDLVSKLAYMLGIQKEMFLTGRATLKYSVYEELDKLKEMRIIRNLCQMRAAMMYNYWGLCTACKEKQYLYSMKKYIPMEAYMQLSDDGISLSKKPGTPAYAYIADINALISDRVNLATKAAGCKNPVPDWVNWNYVRSLFVMKDGTSASTAKDTITNEVEKFFRNINFYPYRTYLCWDPIDVGNLLFNDKKFCETLYTINNDSFSGYSYVCDMEDGDKTTIEDFFQKGQITMLVDGENSNPFKMYAAINSLTNEARSNISRVIIFDDTHASSGWDLFERSVGVPVEHLEIDRVKKNKSLVDIRLTARACKEYYQAGIRNFVIASSDSDFYGLISELQEANFFVLVERDRFSYDLKQALTERKILHCYLDSFNTEDMERLKMLSIVTDVNEYLKKNINVNINTMIESAVRKARIDYTEDEKKNFIRDHVKTMVPTFDADGNMTLQLAF